jgi:fibronectin-binding autotransporter adhesin
MNTPKSNSCLSRRVCALMATAFVSGALLHGDVIEYSGSGSTVNWTDTGNWINGVAPADSLTTDIALFNKASGNYSRQPDVGTTSVLGIEVGNGTTAASLVNFSGTQLSIGSSGINVKALAGAATFNVTTIAVGADQTWTNNSTNSLTVASVISGTSTLTTAGTGTILLTGATSNYAGNIIVSSGSLYISGGSALNASSASTGGVLSANSTVSVAAGANLGIRNTHNLIAGLNDVSGAGGTVGMAQNTNGRSLTIAGSGSYSFSGVVTDRLSGFTGSTLSLVIGNGTSTTDQTFKGANSYSGTTNINAGAVLNIQNDTGLGTTAAGTTVFNGATLQLQGGISVGAETLSLTGNGASGQTGALVNVSGNNTYAGALTLGSGNSVGNTIASNAGLLTLSNTGAVGGATTRTLFLTGAGDGVFAGALSSGAITKTGTGTWTLTGTNTYVNATAVSAGKLLVNGSLTSAVTVANGATFGGTGSSTAALTFQSGSIFEFDIGNAGFFDTTSTITLGNGVASLSLVGTRSGTAVNDVITLLTSVSATSGVFGNLADGGTITSLDGTTWQAAYSGNGLTLTAISLSSVPESSTYALFAGLMVIGCATLRRRRRAIMIG